MCGIIGFYCFDHSTISGRNLARGVKALSHRGPDDEGLIGWNALGEVYLDAGVIEHDLTLGLGHRRLSIFDLSSLGRQPMQGDEGHWIVYNGEIYNFYELRNELKSLGHVFRTGTDTEVILAAYKQWGRDCVSRFNGMWAFVIYDPHNRGLFCSRDRMGIKPFYFIRSEKLFAFSSEVEALHVLLNRNFCLRADQLARYIVYHEIDEGPDTIYQDVYELRGGHGAWVETATGKTNSWRFWDLPSEADLDLDDEQTLERFSEILEDSVRIRLRADVPVAITLSGGTDSSAVTVAARRVSKGPIKTFTSRFPDFADIDESEYALEVARFCGADPVLVEPDLGRLILEEPSITRHQAMPYRTLSHFVHWSILAKVYEQGVPVIICGQGGDELFLGYERYYVSRILALFPNLPAMAVEIFRGSSRSRLSLSELTAYLAFFSSPRLRHSVLMARVRQVFHSDLTKYAPAPHRVITANLRRLQRGEFRGVLSRLLRYDDRNTSAYGMETRLPFLDYRMVEFAFRLGWRHKIRDGWTKYMIRRYLDRHGLKQIAWRRHKLGFDAPQSAWTNELIARRWNELQRHPFCRILLKENFDLDHQTTQVQWDVYNLAHLANLLDWREIKYPNNQTARPDE